MRKTKRIKLAKERQRQRSLTEGDHRFITRLTEKGGDKVSRSDVKAEKKFTRHCNEEARFTSGFHGDIPTTGKEMGPDFVPRLRVSDGVRHVSMKAWVRKGAR